MSRYASLAAGYDRFTMDVNYEAWADYIERHFRRRAGGVETVLDLACGTGSLTWILARRGYDMIGVDLSPDMLAQAADKAEGEGVAANAPLFLCQPMERLALHGPVDACVCTLDAVNHVYGGKRLAQAMERVLRYLKPGGLFLFDVLTPTHFQSVQDGLFLDETEDAYCVWRTQYHPRSRLCDYDVDLFYREGDHWRRESDYHQEYAYTMQELTALLEQAGFCRIRQHGYLQVQKPKPEAGRIFFSAWKEGK